MAQGIETKAGTLKVYPGSPRVFIKCVDHEAFGTRFVPRAHYVWWKYRRQLIPRTHHLHHKNEDSSCDKIGNLQLLTRGDHIRLHKANTDEMIRLGKLEARSSIGRRRRSILATQLHATGVLKTPSKEMQRRYQCTQRAKRIRLLGKYPPVIIKFGEFIHVQLQSK